VESGEGGDLLNIEYRDPERIAGMVAAAGADAYVLEPPELVKSVVALLEAAAGGQR
jgi:predicted DNA-binding transcriptional regulator YafY